VNFVCGYEKLKIIYKILKAADHKTYWHTLEIMTKSRNWAKDRNFGQKSKFRSNNKILAKVDHQKPYV